MEYTATAKYVRTSPRKVRLVARAISGKKVTVALSALGSIPQHAAEPLRKLLESAVANAVQKKATADSLVIKAIDVMGGPVLKRWHAASRGMAHSYKKRMTHVKLTLKEEEKAKHS
ncbi:MAG: 50S ribosomal protein L22 [Patescibacteria group bacterium]